MATYHRFLENKTTVVDVVIMSIERRRVAVVDEHWYFCDKCKKFALARQDQLTTGGIHFDCGNIIPCGA